MAEVMVAADMVAADMEEVMAEATTVSAMRILAADIMAAGGSTRVGAQAFTAITPLRPGTARILVRFEKRRADPENFITPWTLRGPPAPFEKARRQGNQAG